MATFASAAVFCGCDSVDHLVLRVCCSIQRGAHRLVLGLRPSGTASFIGDDIHGSWSAVRAGYYMVLALFFFANGLFFSSIRANNRRSYSQLMTVLEWRSETRQHFVNAHLSIIGHLKYEHAIAV